MAFALLNVARESTFLIGSIQYYGAPQQRDYVGLLRAILSVVLGGTAAGLRRRSPKAWWGAVTGGALFVLKLQSELAWLMQQRIRGSTDADVQIVLLGFALPVLIMGVLLLLTPQARAPIFRKMRPPGSKK